MTCVVGVILLPNIPKEQCDLLHPAEMQGELEGPKEKVDVM